MSDPAQPAPQSSAPFTVDLSSPAQVTFFLGLFGGQLLFAAVVAIVVLSRAKITDPRMIFHQDVFRPLVQLFTIWAGFTVIGNLMLLGVINGAAGCGLLGSIIGYAFGNWVRSKPAAGQGHTTVEPPTTPGPPNSPGKGPAK